MANEPVGIIGAGIIGLATARQLAQAGVPVTVWEKESSVAQHQTGRNSGVVHAGIYYQPGSAKARRLPARRRSCSGPTAPDAICRGTNAASSSVARDELETQRLQARSSAGPRPTAYRGCAGWTARTSARSSQTWPAWPRCCPRLPPSPTTRHRPGLRRRPENRRRRVAHGYSGHGGAPARQRRPGPRPGRDPHSVPAGDLRRVCRPTCWPGRRATRRARRSSRSAASTCGCGPR